MKHVLTAAFVLAALPAFAQAPAAQPAPDNPLSAMLKTHHDGVKAYILKSAEKLPEGDYGFRPAGVAPEVRTFGQMLAHIANSSYFFCARAKGEPNPNASDFEKTATTKGDIVKALNDAFGYCDAVYAGLTDAKALELMTVPGPNDTKRQIVRSAPLFTNIAHNAEHYGNLVTYLRAKGLVPPSSERGSM